MEDFDRKYEVGSRNAGSVHRRDNSRARRATTRGTDDEHNIGFDFAGVDGGKGESHTPTEEMQNVYDKLQIMNYEKEYLSLTKLPPLHRLYFIVPTNPGEQYFNFVSLSSWILQKCGKHIDMPHESEDPNTVICRILRFVREMGAILDFSPSRVKSGCGPDVVSVLDFLTDKALIKSEHEWQSPIFPPEDLCVPDDKDEQLITCEKVDDEAPDCSSEDDDDFKDDMMLNLACKPNAEMTKILHSTSLTEEWQMEVEHILPQLKLTIQAAATDWRLRLEKMKSYANAVEAAIAQSEPPITRIASEAESLKDALASREATLTTQFTDRLNDLYNIHAEIAEIKDKFELRSKEFKEQTRLLAITDDKLRECQRNLDERALSISDGAPLLEARKKLANLKKEIVDFDIQIAVLDHCRFRELDYEDEIDF